MSTADFERKHTRRLQGRRRNAFRTACTFAICAAVAPTFAAATSGSFNCYAPGTGSNGCVNPATQAPAFLSVNAPWTLGPANTERTGSYGKPFAENQTTGTSKQITMYVSGSAVWDGTSSLRYFEASTILYSGATTKTTRYKMLNGGNVNIRLGFHY
jgi:hypothetical protein